MDRILAHQIEFFEEQGIRLHIIRIILVFPIVAEVLGDLIQSVGF